LSISEESQKFLKDYLKFAKNPTIKVARRLLRKLKNMSVSQLVEISQGIKFGEQRIHVGSVVFSKVNPSIASKLTIILAEMNSIVSLHRRSNFSLDKKQGRKASIIH